MIKRDIEAGFFTAEDFGGLSREFWFPELLETANAILRDWVKEQPEVFGGTSIDGANIGLWTLEIADPSDTHTARLVGIREIGRNEKHGDALFGGNYHENLDFIAHAREDLPALLQEVERLWERVEELTEANGDFEVALRQKEGEIGRAEHRGNTVNYIYDKCENYGNQLRQVGPERDALKAENARLRDALLDLEMFLVMNPGDPEQIVHSAIGMVTKARAALEKKS